MVAFRPEEQDVRLQEDDVERGGQGSPSGYARMFVAAETAIAPWPRRRVAVAVIVADALPAGGRGGSRTPTVARRGRPGPRPSLRNQKDAGGVERQPGEQDRPHGVTGRRGLRRPAGAGREHVDFDPLPVGPARVYYRPERTSAPSGAETGG